MRVLIYGGEGYLGWPLSLHLISRGHEVKSLDNFMRDRMVRNLGGDTLTPIQRDDRYGILKRMGGYLDWSDTTYYGNVVNDLELFAPDAIVHLGEIPSAPFSMKGPKEAFVTQYNNTLGTLNILWVMREVCPKAHLLKLGTMGEFGTPNIDIPEGSFEVDHRGRKDTLPFPRQPGSFYHASKVHDSINIELACKIWGLRSTDIMQGVVYGVTTEDITDESLNTRFDYDEMFGTAINRFCVQALIDIPLTLYGKGKQQRGFIPLRDSIQCMTLAIENPPEQGEYRVLNQFEEIYTLEDLAVIVQHVAKDMGYDVDVSHLDNPRVEAEDHYYNPDHKKLLDMGYKPTRNMKSEIKATMTYLEQYKDRAIKDVILPKTQWR